MSPSNVTPCMGGWCILRDHCAHYHSGRRVQQPSERLCIPGRDGHSDLADVRVTAQNRVVRIATPADEVMA